MYYIGIDGGGTKTKAILTDKKGNVLGIGISGPSSIRTVSNEVTKENIHNAIKEALNEKDITLESVFAGLGDIESEEDKLLVEAMIQESVYVSDTTLVKVESDVFGALYGGLGDLESGVSVIIGTGSVAFGLNNNMFSRVGGYSFKEGDPGSSFYLGRLCLWHVSRLLDGRSEMTDFGKELYDILNITTRVSYLEALDEYYNERTKTAQLAKLVTKHAEKNDKYAIDIMMIGVKGIVEIIDTCKKQLNLDVPHVAVIGSLGNYPIYFDSIKQELLKLDSSYNVFENILDPSLGAVIGAMKLAGQTVDKSLVENFKNQKL